MKLTKCDHCNVLTFPFNEFVDFLWKKEHMKNIRSIGGIPPEWTCVQCYAMKIPAKYYPKNLLKGNEYIELAAIQIEGEYSIVKDLKMLENKE